MRNNLNAWRENQTGLVHLQSMNHYHATACGLWMRQSDGTPTGKKLRGFHDPTCQACKNWLNRVTKFVLGVQELKKRSGRP